MNISHSKKELDKAFIRLWRVSVRPVHRLPGTPRPLGEANDVCALNSLAP